MVYHWSVLDCSHSLTNDIILVKKKPSENALVSEILS